MSITSERERRAAYVLHVRLLLAMGRERAYRDHVRRMAEEAPPLTPEQIATIAVLLREPL